MNTAIVATFGRGLWKINVRVRRNASDWRELLADIEESCGDDCLVIRPGHPDDDGRSPRDDDGRSSRNVGSLVELMQSGRPPFDAVMLILDGRLLDVKAANERIEEVVVTAGSSHVVFVGSRKPSIEFEAALEEVRFVESIPGPLPGGAIEGVAGAHGLVEQGVIPVGLVFEQGRIIGTVVAGQELPIPQPGPVVAFEEKGQPVSPTEGKPYVTIGSAALSATGDVLEIRGRGYDPSRPIEIWISGQKREESVMPDQQGEFEVGLKLEDLVVERTYQVLVRQVLDDQRELVDVSSFYVPHADKGADEEIE